MPSAHIAAQLFCWCASHQQVGATQWIVIVAGEVQWCGQREVIHGSFIHGNKVMGNKLAWRMLANHLNHGIVVVDHLIRGEASIG